jgi:phosphotransacetylase
VNREVCLATGAVSAAAQNGIPSTAGYTGETCVAASDPTGKFTALIAQYGPIPLIRTAIVHPCDETSLRSAIHARALGFIEPVLVGPSLRIQALAASLSIDISALELVDVPHSHAAAERGVALAREGSVQALLKGSLRTEEFMSAVVDKVNGLRTGRRISHVFVMDVPAYPKLLLVSDAAVNLFPRLEEKCDIVKNAIELAHVLGTAVPKVAILSAVETVTSSLPATIDAAALCKMADRGQISGAVLDGPLALDNAISRASAATKGIRSPVAGDADILIAPDLEAGNILAKDLSFLAGACAAGIVLGARVPIMLSSRADDVPSHLASCAVAALFAKALRSGSA